MDVKVQFPISPDSPERAKLDELVSVLNVLVKNASSGQERSAVDGLKDILGAFSSVPLGVRGRIQSHYRKVSQKPDFKLSDLVIEGDFLKELLELGAKLDTAGGHEEKLRRLIGYSRGFVEARLQTSPDSRLTDTEALVASSPFQNLGILDYFRKKWGSKLPQKLDYSEFREGFNAYWRETEAAAQQERGNMKATARIEPSRVKTLVMEVPVEPSRKKTFVESPDEATVKGKALMESSEEKTMADIRILKYDKPLEGLYPLHLEIKDVIYCETASGFVYEFIVKNKNNNFVELEGVNGKYAGGQLFINDEAILLNGAIKFLEGGKINEITTLEVRKRVGLSKNIRKSGIQTLAREQNELEEQDSEVAAIGDSNGNFEAYQSNLKLFGVIDDSGHWIAKNKKVVIHGDIVADRHAEGFKILEHISSLRAEAKRAGGDLVVIAGNHEDFMFSFLLDKKVKGPPHEVESSGIIAVSEEYDPVDLCYQGEGSKRGAQGAGLLELTQFTGDKKMAESFASVSQERLVGALPAMRKDPRGMRLLEEMCQMKLCERIDATIFIHTDPTNEIMETIMEMGVEEINGHFQEILRKSLIKGEPFDPRYNFLFDTFLYTENRTFNNIFGRKDKDGKRKRLNREPDLRKDLVRQLKEKGIRQVIFGHSDLGLGNHSVLFEGINFINVDQSAGKDKDEDISTASGAFVNTKAEEKPKTGTVVMAMSEIEKDKK